MKEIYFDNASTTMVIDEVAAPIMRAMTSEYGNPSSLHKMGLQSQKLLEKAALSVLTAAGAKDGKIVFTSGGTESNNLAIFGAAGALGRRGKRIITTQIEHASVEGPFAQLKKQGFDVVTLVPDSNGFIHLSELEKVLTDDTILVSMMAVNNEIGAIEPFAKAAGLVKEKCPIALFHCDGVQAFGKIPLNVQKSGIDLLSVSGHKIHGPKGVGALYIAPKVRITPLLYGGGQQGDIRPGTENVPLAVGLGQAAELAFAGISSSWDNVMQIKNHLQSKLENIDGIEINSPCENCSPYILSFAVKGYRSETVLHYLEQESVYVSSGSACSRGAKSGVLKAMGKDNAIIDSTIRVSFNRFNIVEEADIFTDVLNGAMKNLRKSK